MRTIVVSVALVAGLAAVPAAEAPVNECGCG